MTIETNGAPDHRHALELVTERLAAEFTTGPEQAGAVVAEAYARTREARVQAFRVLLAERDARAALHAQAGAADAPPFRATA